jgi:PAS domain S-box-containing protein
MAQQSIELILFRQLAQALAVPVFLVDERGDLIFLNEAAESLLGIRFEDLDDLPFDRWTTMFRPKGPDGRLIAADALPLAQAVLHRRPAHGSMAITGSDGVARSLEVTAFPLEGGRGRLLGAVAMFWERDH